MKSHQNWPRPIRVCVAYIPILTAIYTWFWFESNGGRIDSSVHRSALYLVYFLIFPIGIAAFFIHLFATLGTHGTLKWRFAHSTISGFLGILTLHLIITTSPDEESGMAYLATAIAFCAFAVAGFFISTLVFYVMSIVRNKKNNSKLEAPHR